MTVVTCIDCRQETKHCAKGRCKTCYHRYLRKKNPEKYKFNAKRWLEIPENRKRMLELNRSYLHRHPEKREACYGKRTRRLRKNSVREFVSKAIPVGYKRYEQEILNIWENTDEKSKVIYHKYYVNVLAAILIILTERDRNMKYTRGRGTESNSNSM